VRVDTSNTLFNYTATKLLFPGHKFYAVEIEAYTMRTKGLAEINFGNKCSWERKVLGTKKS